MAGREGLPKKGGGGVGSLFVLRRAGLGRSCPTRKAACEVLLGESGVAKLNSMELKRVPAGGHEPKFQQVGNSPVCAVLLLPAG